MPEAPPHDRKEVPEHTGLQSPGRSGAHAGPGTCRPSDPVNRRTMVLVVAFFVLTGHIQSIGMGLWLDDHIHYAHLRELDWSFHSAVEASRLGVVGDVMDIWGRLGSELRFFRPVAFWIMKLEYTIGQWQPMAMHGFSLGWHFACSMLVGALAMRCLGRRLWATAAAALMAIHPGHVPTVDWIACQTELMATAFLLMGILAYARHAGWGRRIFVRHPEASMRPESAAAGSHRPVTAAGIAAVICYALALGCRENAVLFPLVCWAGDRLCGSPRPRLVRWEHAAMGLLLIVYLALRWVMLGGLPLPGRPYIMPLSDPAFGRFLIEKIAYYTIGLIALVPVIPMGGRSFFAGRPGVFYGTLAAVIVILLVIWAVYRFRRALLWPVVWTACLIAPTMPLFASSHHLYLPSAGTVVLVAAGLAALGGVLRPPGRPIGRPRAWLCGMLLVTVALVLGAMSWASEFAYTRGTLVEDLVVEDTIRRGRAIHDGDYLFFINLPVVAYYVVPALEEALGVKNLKGHVLTFATDLTRMQAPSEVEILDAHRIRVRAPENERYFEGITGRTMLEVMEFSDVPAAGEPIDAGPFTVVPTVTDGRGIRELLFTYNERLDSPGYHFFFGSPQFLAYPLDVSRPTHAPKLPETRSAPGAMATAGHNSVESGRE